MSVAKRSTGTSFSMYRNALKSCYRLKRYRLQVITLSHCLLQLYISGVLVPCPCGWEDLYRRKALGLLHPAPVMFTWLLLCLLLGLFLPSCRWRLARLAKRPAMLSMFARDPTSRSRSRNVFIFDYAQFNNKLAAVIQIITRKPSIEAGIWRNAISYSTWNEM